MAEMGDQTINRSTAENLLVEARQTIGQRASDRDVEQERSMAGTVAAFNAMFGTNLTESQGWAFMVLLKMKRGTTGGRYRPDDFVDGAAYFGLFGESVEQEHAKASNDVRSAS